MPLPRSSYRGPRYFYLRYSQFPLSLNKLIHQTGRWTNPNICYDLGYHLRNSNLNLPWFSPNLPHVLVYCLLAVHLFDNYIPRALSLFPIFLAPNAGIWWAIIYLSTSESLTPNCTRLDLQLLSLGGVSLWLTPSCHKHRTQTITVIPK